MRTLTLSLKRKWFDMIKSGVKKEEYRERSPYWRKRLIMFYDIITHHSEDGYYVYKTFDTLVFTLGYPKADDTERRLVFKNPRIRIGEGRPEWGAEPGKLYFVISWEA